MSNNEEEATGKEKRIIEPIAPALGINYASSPLLEYAYPPINETIVANITNAIIAVPKLYTQVLHLMNKMNLPPPFGPLRKRPEMPSSDKTKDEIKYYGKNILKENDMEEEEEVEDFEDKRTHIDNPFSRTQVTKPAIVSSTPITSAVNPPQPNLSDHPDQLDKSNRPIQPIQLIPPRQAIQTPSSNLPSQSGKIVSVEKAEIKNMFATPNAVRSCISLQDILKHRISKEEMSHQKAFANYSYGDPSCKLYLRNMTKDVTAEDIIRLFGCFFDSDEQAQEQLQVRVMEGRMKGQAFVTFPSVELAREALVTVNGYLLKDKPIVICFGKQT